MSKSTEALHTDCRYLKHREGHQIRYILCYSCIWDMDSNCPSSVWNWFLFCALSYLTTWSDILGLPSLYDKKSTSFVCGLLEFSLGGTGSQTQMPICSYQGLRITVQTLSAIHIPLWDLIQCQVAQKCLAWLCPNWKLTTVHYKKKKNHCLISKMCVFKKHLMHKLCIFSLIPFCFHHTLNVW